MMATAGLCCGAPDSRKWPVNLAAVVAESGAEEQSLCPLPTSGGAHPMGDPARAQGLDSGYADRVALCYIARFSDLTAFHAKRKRVIPWDAAAGAGSCDSFCGLERNEH